MPQEPGHGAVDLEPATQQDGDGASAQCDGSRRPDGKTAYELAVGTHDRHRSVAIERRDPATVDGDSDDLSRGSREHLAVPVVLVVRDQPDGAGAIRRARTSQRIGEDGAV